MSDSDDLYGGPRLSSKDQLLIDAVNKQLGPTNLKARFGEGDKGGLAVHLEVRGYAMDDLKLFLGEHSDHPDTNAYKAGELLSRADVTLLWGDKILTRKPTL